MLLGECNQHVVIGTVCSTFASVVLVYFLAARWRVGGVSG